MISGVLLQVVLAGLAQGAVLGLVALGFTLVAGTARILPFAHGDIAVGSVFLGVLAAVGATPTAARLALVPSAALVILSLAVGVLLSGTVAALVVLPSMTGPDGTGRRPSPLSWVVGGLAAGLLLRAVLGSYLRQQAYALPDPLRLDALAPGGLLRLPGGSTVEVRAVCVLALGLMAGLLAEAVLVRSRFGRSLRAVADDPAGAALCGISPPPGGLRGVPGGRPAGRAGRPAGGTGTGAVGRERSPARPRRGGRGAARGSRFGARSAGRRVGGGSRPGAGRLRLRLGVLRPGTAGAAGGRPDAAPAGRSRPDPADRPYAVPRTVLDRAAPDSPRVSAVGVAQVLWLLVAALGLALSVSYAGIPMLGQSAFVAMGGYGVLLLGPGGAGLPLGIAAGLAVLLAAAAGYLTALGTARLDGGYLALATWALAWLAQRIPTAFPDLFGGTEGITRAAPARLVSRTLGVELTLTNRINLGLAAATCLLTVAALYRLGRGPAALDLAALRESPQLAAFLGVPVAARRRAVLTVTAALGAVSGAGSTALIGVISPADVSPLLSLELLLAVLIGGLARWWAAVLGIAVLSVLPAGGFALAGPAELTGTPWRAVLTALLLLAAVAVRELPHRRGTGLVPRPWPVAAVPPSRPVRDGVSLELAHASVSYAGVTALDDVSLTLRGGQVHALVGPNGSGKSTLLEVLAGGLDAGTVRIGGIPQRAGSVPDRVRAGVVRTPQQPMVLAGLSPAQQVALGARGGRAWPQAVVRQLFGTPRSRLQTAELHAVATGTLAGLGLSRLADLDPARLTAGERQLVQVARAVATGAPVLLFDEPAAGMTAAERALLPDLLRGLAETGAAVLIVEHDLRLVSAVADRVTVLDAGRVLATGAAAVVHADPAVRQALLGTS